MKIAVDFDGTIAEFMFPEIGPPVPGAFEWMGRWQEAGGRLILWTCRGTYGELYAPELRSDRLGEAVEFCRENGIEFEVVNQDTEDRSFSSSNKAMADVYVDDAAFGCPLIPATVSSRPMVDWSIVGPAILERIHETTNSST
jgi:hypothetical protein